uniref:Mitochondrial inner membrane protease ATP23 n=2 Tax=Lygus hesperus TaxID=30085 RepID=A0A0A9YWB9_LYGHE
MCVARSCGSCGSVPTFPGLKSFFKLPVKDQKRMSENEKPNDVSEDSSKYGEDPSKYGYSLYPERKGKYEKTWSGVLSGHQGLEEYDKIKCEKRVAKCFVKSKLVKLMAGALKSAGCEIDMRRHVVCEVCHPRVSGGFDPETNQIVICQNNSKDDGVVQGILTHEMIHMFDYCKNQIDFKNIDHLACTEIRAANLTHCSFLSAVLQGDCSPFNFANRHRHCVRSKAIISIVAVRDVSAELAAEAVDRVFDRCYQDMEPIGRRVKNYEDATRAYAEGFLYGYI